MRQAAKNPNNNIQYDCKTNTIGENLRKNNESSNPILATLKAKRGLYNDIGFGSKPPRSQAAEKSAQYAASKTASDQYLGPGYYEQKGGFDKYAANSKGASVGITQSKSCGNFMSTAPRWVDPKNTKSRMKCQIPGPG